MVSLSNMGDKRSNYLDPDVGQSTFVRNLMTASPTKLLGDQLQPSRPSSGASSVPTESLPGSPGRALPPKLGSSPALSVTSSLLHPKSAPGSPTGASESSFRFDDNDDLRSLLGDGSNAQIKRGRSASIAVPMVSVTTSELSVPQSPRALNTDGSTNHLSVDYPTKVPDSYFGKAKRVERTKSFPLRRQETITSGIGESLTRRPINENGETETTTSAADSNGYSYEETVTDTSTAERAQKPVDVKPNQVETQGQSSSSSDSSEIDKSNATADESSASGVQQNNIGNKIPSEPPEDSIDVNSAAEAEASSSRLNTEDTVDRERPKMTREGTFTKDSPPPNTDGDQQQEVTTNGSNHALLDKVQLENDNESGYVEQDSDDPLAERLQELDGQLVEDGLQDTFPDNEDTNKPAAKKLKKQRTIDDVLGPELAKLGLAPSIGSPTPKSRPPTPDEDGMAPDETQSGGVVENKESTPQNSQIKEENELPDKPESSNGTQSAGRGPSTEGTPSPERESVSPGSRHSAHSRPDTPANDTSSRPDSPASARTNSAHTYTSLSNREGEPEETPRSRPETPGKKESHVQSRASAASARKQSESRQSVESDDEVFNTDESRPATASSEGKPESRPTSVASEGKPESKPTSVASKGKPESKPTSVASEGKPESRPTSAASKGKPESRPTSVASEGKPESRPTSAASEGKPESRPTSVQSKSGPVSPMSENKADSRPATSESEHERESRSVTPAPKPSGPVSPVSDKDRSIQSSNHEILSRATTRDNNFLQSPVVSRPDTPIRSVPIGSEEAMAHSQSTTLLIDEMIQATITKAESNVNKLEDAISPEPLEHSEAISPVISEKALKKSESSLAESTHSEKEMEKSNSAMVRSRSPSPAYLNRQMDTPIPPTKDLDDLYDDEEFEDDDISRSKSYSSLPPNEPESAEPDIEVIHGDDGPKLKSDSDPNLLGLDDLKEGNVLMSNLSVNKSNQRPISPTPPRNVAKPDDVKKATSRKALGKGAIASNRTALRQTKSFSPRTVGPRTITSPKGRPARSMGRGVTKGELGKVRPPPKRPMPTLNNKPRVQLSPKENPNRNKPLKPVWRPVGAATVKNNQWITPSEPLPPVAKKQGFSPESSNSPGDRPLLVVGKPKIPSQLQSEAWWQNGRFNITIKGPETVLPPLPSCLVSVNPGSDVHGELDNIITEPIDVQITFRPEDNPPPPSYRHTYFRGNPPLRPPAKPSDRNVVNSRAAYPPFNTRIDTPKGVRGKLRADRRPVKAYVNSISNNPLNPNSQNN